ncbi:MAG: hypothetical protein WCW93_03775 [Candidatus Paceibacterota bacterium]|jgi:hypothetical protein
MKKFIWLALVLCFVALPANALVQKATLINSSGNKVVVEVGSQVAQRLFSMGYTLMGAQPAIGGFNLYPQVPAKIGTSTSSPLYMLTTTASTTLTVTIPNSNALRLNTALVASTSVAILNWGLEFSNDDGANKQWYLEDAYTVTSNTLYTHGADALLHLWTPANTVASTTYKSFYLTNLDAKYLRITASIKGANGGLYMEAIPVEKSSY